MQEVQEAAQPLFACRHCQKTISPSEADDAAHNDWERSEGTPFPLGVSWVVAEQAYNFALYSSAAHGVALRFYARGEYSQPCATFAFDPRRNKTGNIWHARIPRSEIEPAEFYAFVVDAPDGSASQKLLLDPYARSILFPDSFDRDKARRPGSNEGTAALCLLDECQCGVALPPRQRLRHGSDLIIYEMHVRGFTRHPSSGVPEHQRGTFAGVVRKVPYLKELGVTAVELMPVFQFDPQDDDYWGYMPINFFAPHQGYSSQPQRCSQRSEFREMVDALHAAGIEVILDVVYNHTGEGDQRGPIYSFKGTDPAAYYMVSRDPEAPYANYSGTGNTLNTSHPAVRRLIVDSMSYWATEMKVDGFRFDLASIFTRRSDGAVAVEEPPIVAEIDSDPLLTGARLIAEPWDAAGVFQLGQAFPASSWMQWNGRYRDTLQRFVRGDAGMVGELMTRLYGSSDLFPDDWPRNHRPYQSVNYVTAHDGFTMYDMVSFNVKRNWANGYDNQDGAGDFSWNCGWEGDEAVPGEVMQVRKRQVKNFFCLLLLSNGTPMFRMGDEFLQTQGGNNNPFNQDNETTWLDWSRTKAHEDVFQFVREMIAFRKRHPSICRSRFWREDIAWFGTAGDVDLSPASRTLAYLLSGASVDDDDLYVMINGGDAPVQFQLQRSDPARPWRRAVDTGLEPPAEIARMGQEKEVGKSSYMVNNRSVVVLRR